MPTAAQTEMNTRERRFKKVLLDDEQRVMGADELDAVTTLGIEIDGEVTHISLDGLNETVLKRLIIDGLYSHLTRAVHAAKPKADDAETAVKVIHESYAKLKDGVFRRPRASSVGPIRAFDTLRFKTAIAAAAKAMNKTLNDEKLDGLLLKLSSMCGKDRQKYMQKTFMSDPHFKQAWEAPILAKKKAAIKKGEVESALDVLVD